MPPKKTTPTKSATKKVTPTKPGVSKPSTVGRGTNATGRTHGTKQATTGPGKKAVPVKGKTSAGNSKGDVKSLTDGASKKRVWTEKDTMARKIQNAYRVYRCRKKLLMLKKKKEEFDALMETLEREVFVHISDGVLYMRHVWQTLSFDELECNANWQAFSLASRVILM